MALSSTPFPFYATTSQSTKTLKMTTKETLELFAAIVAIAGAFVSLLIWNNKNKVFCRKSKELETYLKEQILGYSAGTVKEYQFSFLHITAKFGLTESQILKASVDPKLNIKRVIKSDKEGFAAKILFQYNDDKTN